MKNLAQRFLSEDEQRKITEAVHTAEKLTSGEIVPMVVSESHSYPVAPIIGGVFFGLPTALLAARLLGGQLWLGTDNMWLFLAFFLVYYGTAYLTIVRVPRLKRFFLNPARVELAVQQGAEAVFYRESLYDTRDANGILLYISVFERRVWVLADKGINEKIDPHTWQEIVDQVATGVKKGKSCQSICEAVERIGRLLQEHFPIKDDDKDELHNLIIR